MSWCNNNDNSNDNSNDDDNHYHVTVFNDIK